MKPVIKYVLILLSYLIIQNLKAQNPNFHLLNAESGLSHNNTTSVIRDERGFVWIGTNFGLNRYNGSTFELFTTNSKPFNIINNNVTCLNIDSKGNLLIGTLAGVTIFDKNLEKSVNLGFENLKQKIEVTCIFPFSEDIIFIGTKDILIIYDYSKHKLVKTITRREMNVQQAMNFNNIWQFYSQNNKCYAIIGNKVYEVKNKNFEFDKIFEFADFTKTVFCIAKTANPNQLWLGGKNLLLKVDLNKKTFQNYLQLLNLNKNNSNVEISTLLNFDKKLLVGISGCGIGILDEQNFKIIEELAFPDFAGANRFSGALEDKSGTFWITTDNGVLYSTPWHRKIENIELTRKNNEKKELEIRCISSVGKHQIWVGTTSGIYEINEISNTIKQLEIIDSLGKNLTNICSIKKLNSGKILIGTSFGVYSLNKNKCKKERFNINPNMLSRAWCLENAGKYFYISTLNNLIIRYDTVLRTTTEFETEDLNQSFFNFLIIKNSIYAGGFGAVYKWNFDGSNCRKYKVGNSQICHLIYSDNKIIAATQNDGIIETDTSGSVISNYLNEGKYIIYRILKMDEKMLCATNKGMIIIQNKSKEMLMNTTMGLAENSFNFGDIFYNNGSKFIFSTNHKLHQIKGKFAFRNEIYNPVIDKIRLDDSVFFHPLKTVFPKKITSLQHLSFYTTWTQWLQNDNTLEYLFCAGKNDFTVTGGNEWISSNLNIGKHFCYIQNIFSNKKYNTYSFRVTPVFYQSIWFKTMVILVIFIVIVILTRLYIANRYISKKLYTGNLRILNSEKEREKMELQALRSQMNPHLIFNSLSGIQTLIMQQKTEKAVKFLHDFSSLLRSVLDLSSHSRVLLSKEIEFISNYLELHKLRYSQFNYSIKIDEKLNSSNVFIPSMCIQPVVENCFIHAFANIDEAPQVELVIEKISEKSILVKVWDNGIDFTEKFEKNKTSIGLGNLRRRLEKWSEKYKINKNIEIERKIRGKSVIFELPLLIDDEA